MYVRQIGKIRYSEVLLESEYSRTILSSALAHLKAIPLRVEHLAYSNQFDSVVFSPELPLTPEGQEVPNYFVEINLDEEGLFQSARFVHEDTISDCMGLVLYLPILGKSSL